MKPFYHPAAEHLEWLSQPWSCSYSGGKDSTSLVMWIEWLRRSGWITVERPQLIRSDTGVEDIDLLSVAEEMTSLLAAYGWECILVRPEVHERLYNQILGRGLPPIHPGIRRMRWCTRSTKIDPMARRSASGLFLTGLRLGESAMRDGKLKGSACSAGGECGIPEPSKNTRSPLLEWRTCHVVDWLNGLVDGDVRHAIQDMLDVAAKLVAVYGFRVGQPSFATFGEPEIKAARFGCIGCPAIGAEREAPRSVVARYGTGSPLNELYDVWYEARQPQNRLVNSSPRKLGKPGPVRIDARKRLFARVVDIQDRAGVVLIGRDDEAFIRQCWKDKVYPRGWSVADEATAVLTEDSLYDAADD